MPSHGLPHSNTGCKTGVRTHWLFHSFERLSSLSQLREVLLADTAAAVKVAQGFGAQGIAGTGCGRRVAALWET